MKRVFAFGIAAFCRRRDNAREDFQILVKQLSSSPALEQTLSAETRQAIFYYAGLSYKQLNQSSDARLGQKIQNELSKLKS